MTGSKRKRGADSWRLEVTIGTDVRGKPNRYSKTVHCKSAAEADKELAKFYVECSEGKVRRQCAEKVSDLCDLYYKEYAERFLKKSTLHGIKTATDHWIMPRFGKKKCSKLTHVDIQLWINDMDDAGLSPKTIRNYVSIFSSMIQFAIDMDIIDDTPCKNLRFPKKEKRKAEYLSINEVKALLRGIQSLTDDDYDYRCALLLLLFGGLRRGEVFGLNWEDVDFDNSKIRIHRTRMVDRQGYIFEDTPKTSSSIRSITMPAEVMEELRRLKVIQKKRQLKYGSSFEQSDAVLQKPLGGLMHPSTMYHWYQRFMVGIGLPKISLHALRHTHASMLARTTDDKMQISERLGHADLTTTLNIYTHLFENSDKEIANELSRTFFSSK
ncbi:MAG: tyrosine-type recombinase/integrase [Bacillota bacterium]|nr:tyrosine-type recombinase/integrase [Bacillota bacterium]